METGGWYTLYAPASELQLKSFADVQKQQKWLTDLLLLYTEDFFKRLKAVYEGQFYRETGRQWLSFIDPKGIRQMGWDDPKFGLYEEVKALERTLKPDLTLNSFILSASAREDTAQTGALAQFGKTEAEFAAKHILFMDRADYLQKMFAMMLEEGGALQYTGF